MHEIYVIVVFETVIAIFNQQDGKFLETQGDLDRWRYKSASLNHDRGDIMLVVHNTSKNTTNVVQTRIMQLMEIPAEIQIT